MEIGIDSFAAAPTNSEISSSQAITELLKRIEMADKVGRTEITQVRADLPLFPLADREVIEPFLDWVETMV